MILLRFSYQTLRAGINLPDRFVNGENALYLLVDTPMTRSIGEDGRLDICLGVWEALPNAWECLESCYGNEEL
jgi:hypothetical protein